MKGTSLAKTVGVILAGGLATRMGGGDKGLLPLGNGCVLDGVIERLAAQCDALAINANGDPDRFARFRLPILPDTVADFPGPLAGVLAGLDWAAAQHADQIVTVAADTPFFPRDLVVRLQDAAAEVRAPIALAASFDETGTMRRHPTFGLWQVGLRDDLRDALAQGMRKVTLWGDRHGAAAAFFDAESFDPFFNINTPDDLERAKALLGRNIQF